jgi:hypothetical protein
MDIVANTHTMPQESRPVTPASVAAARAYCTAQRVAYGFNPDPDADPIMVGPAVVLRFDLTAQRPIGPRTLPMGRQLDLNESVDALVEEYGLPQVIRTVKLLAAMNGVEV